MGLMFIADTTYPPYWWRSIGVGLLLLAWIAAARLRHLRSIAAAFGLTGVVAGTFVVIYS